MPFVGQTAEDRRSGLQVENHCEPLIEGAARPVGAG